MPAFKKTGKRTSSWSWKLAALCLTFLLTLSASFPGRQSEEPGTISGNVSLADETLPSRVVVYVDQVPGRRFAPPAKPELVDQYRLAFVPHVLPILQGTTVIFPNSDEVRHNVFSTSPAKRFNLGIYPPASSKSVTFDKPGVVKLLCSLHPEMSAYLIVLQNPFYAVIVRKGSYVIANLPPGKYVVKTWRENAPEQAKEVEVVSRRTARVDWELKD